MLPVFGAICGSTSTTCIPATVPDTAPPDTVPFVTISTPRPAWPGTMAVAALMFGLVACGGDERPTTAEWSAAWTAEQARVPTADELLAGGRSLCDESVADLRSSRDRLEPTPSEALDAAVDDWIGHAEALVFECPTDPDEVGGRYEQLAVFAAEIDAGLDQATD
jgi:hypothetical protein